MTSVGRGRARGGRILDTVQLQKALEKAMVGGRGISVPSTNELRSTAGRGAHLRKFESNVITSGPTSDVLSSQDKTTLVVNSANDPRELLDKSDVLSSQDKTTLVVNSANDPRELLDKELMVIWNKGKGCFIKLALNFFSASDDVEYFMDKVMKLVLGTSVLVKSFSMSLKLLTLHKIHGEKIKSEIFSTLQTFFQDVVNILTVDYADVDTISDEQREKANRLCDLMGQIYFCYRPLLDSLQKYEVLAKPTAMCMRYLLFGGKTWGMILFAKQVALNYKSLHSNPELKEYMELVRVKAHQELLFGRRSEKEQALLLYAIDLMSVPDNGLPEGLVQFYRKELSSRWSELSDVCITSPVQILSNITYEIVLSNKFDVDVDKYCNNRFVEL